MAVKATRKPRKKVRLTEEGVKRMRPPSKDKKQIAIFDSGMPGLVLRLGFGGGKSFYAIQYSKQPGDGTEGKSRWRTVWHKIGAFDPDGADEWPEPGSSAPLPRQLTVRGARDAARKLLGNVAAYSGTRTGTTLASSRFEKVAEEYLKRHCANLRSKPDIERVLKKYVFDFREEKGQDFWRDRPFNSIRRSDVNALHNHISDKHGPRQADYVFAIVRSMMRWFASEGDDDSYVCPVGPRKKKAGQNGKRGRDRVLTADEIKAVWEAAGRLDKNSDGEEIVCKFGAMVKLLLLTASRRAKLRTMRRSDIVGNVWNIPKDHPNEKGNAGSLTLPPFALSILEGIPELLNCPFYFVGRYGGDTAFNSFSQGMEDLRKLLPPDMPNWTLHDLRRTARTIMTDVGVSDRVAEMVLGHEIKSLVEATYNRSTYASQKADALQKLADYLEGLVDPKGNWKRKARATSATASAAARRKAIGAKSRTRRGAKAADPEPV